MSFADPRCKDEQLAEGSLAPCILKFGFASLGFAGSQDTNMAFQGPCILIPYRASFCCCTIVFPNQLSGDPPSPLRYKTRRGVAYPSPYPRA